MTKAEQLYCGPVGAAYWERNSKRLDHEAARRMLAIRNLIPDQDIQSARWVEVGCGQGHNLCDGDIGIDIDPRQLEGFDQCEWTGIVAPVYNIPLPDQSYEVVFSVGCLMHLPSNEPFPNGEGWQDAVKEMARIARSYIIIGEYWADQEQEIEWHGEKGVLWARPYTVPGFTLIEKVHFLKPFDDNIFFGIFKKTPTSGEKE